MQRKIKRNDKFKLYILLSLLIHLSIVYYILAKSIPEKPKPIEISIIEQKPEPINKPEEKKLQPVKRDFIRRGPHGKTTKYGYYGMGIHISTAYDEPVEVGGRVHFGWRIEEIAEDSPAENYGLQKGDIIVLIDDEDVSKYGDFNKNKQKKLNLLIKRGYSIFKLELETDWIPLD